MRNPTVTPVEQQKHDDVIGSLAGVFKAKDMVAANSLPQPTPAKTADDVEDMWDNLPV